MERKHNTIFDDVFRTMVQKMPELLIPVINEVFSTNYTEKDYFSQLRNEHEEQFGKVITDSIIQIGGKLYHIECQSVEDSTMVIRMIEYDFAIALEQTLKNGKPYEMDFPHSCVIYLRHSKSTPDKLNLKIPYYIMRYEALLSDIHQDVEKLNMLLAEYEDIRLRLEAELYDEGKSVLYEDLIHLIILISDYMIKSKEVRERLGDIMGGKVLELESERLLRIGREEGREEGALAIMVAMYHSGKVTLEEACAYLGITEEEFSKKERASVE